MSVNYPGNTGDVAVCRERQIQQEKLLENNEES